MAAVRIIYTITDLFHIQYHYTRLAKGLFYGGKMYSQSIYLEYLSPHIHGMHICCFYHYSSYVISLYSEESSQHHSRENQLQGIGTYYSASMCHFTMNMALCQMVWGVLQTADSH